MDDEARLAGGTGERVEQAGSTETMRHIPPLEEVLGRVGTVHRARIRRAIQTLTHPELPPETRRAAERRLAQVASWLDRITTAARRGRAPAHHEAADPISRVEGALDGAIEALERIDRSEFGWRAPFHRFEQSRSEPLWEAVLATGYAIQLLLDELASFDRELWWDLLDPRAREEIAPALS